ncbi:uncharacterized protein LOC135479660 [Liolophura sinensis]|uniref:uncharacterized protein LOC135479660 n=1 Tax=Liolophura sinensis TaxID=3198878 RepID=UPI0031590FA3
MFAGLLLLVASCILGAQANWTEVIKNGNSKLTTALKHKNFETISKTYAPASDFTFIQGGKTLVMSLNNQDTADWFRSMSDKGIVDLDLTTMAITNLGDVANERGRYKLSRANGSVAYSGVYLTSWYLKNGKLQITMAMWT